MPSVGLFAYCFLLSSGRAVIDDDEEDVHVDALQAGMSNALRIMSLSKAQLIAVSETTQSASFLLSKLLELITTYRNIFDWRGSARTDRGKKLVNSYTEVCEAVSAMVSSLQTCGNIRVAEVGLLRAALLRLRRVAMPGRVYKALTLTIGTVNVGGATRQSRDLADIYVRVELLPLHANATALFRIQTECKGAATSSLPRLPTLPPVRPLFSAQADAPRCTVDCGRPLPHHELLLPPVAVALGSECRMLMCVWVCVNQLVLLLNPTHIALHPRSLLRDVRAHHKLLPPLCVVPAVQKTRPLPLSTRPFGCRLWSRRRHGCGFR